MEDMEEEHLISFGEDEGSASDDCNSLSDDDDSSVEITSTIDECENELIQLSTYLHLGTEDINSDDDEKFEWPEPPSPLISTDSSDVDESNNSYPTSSTTSTKTDNAKGKTRKRKRRQWLIREKLEIIAFFESNGSKRETARKKDYTEAQLRNWIKNKENLINLSKMKKGNKRKRLLGGGKKLVYVDLDHRLFQWYRSRRTDPNDKSINSVDIRREKVTLRHLQKEGKRISKELNHTPPSTKWYFRFLKRHDLSLQRPKRQDKVPIHEVHCLAKSFYEFNRRASCWSLKRGPMGAFTNSDICNMDESPLALFGDQSVRSVNDVGTSNEINGYISNKRFSTVILTVFAKNQRMGPVVLFKGKGKISAEERQQYAKDVQVIFTPKAVINGPSMDVYVNSWLKKVNDGHPKLFIGDSAGSHLKPEIIQKLRRNNAVVSIIPKGCTQYLQILDTLVFSVFKNHYQDAADEYIDLHGSRSKIKLSAKQQRILCSRFISTAWRRTQKSIDFERAFFEMGYIWNDDSPISIRTLPGFVFDPSSCSSHVADETQGKDAAPIMIEEDDVQVLNVHRNQMKQLSLDQFLKVKV